MMEISEVRRLLRQVVERARRATADRRAAVDRAREHYETFLGGTAEPAVRLFVTALRGEGYPFRLDTPAGALRLVPDHPPDNYIEIDIDPSASPTVVGRIRFTRGRDVTVVERPIREGARIEDLTDEDVLRFLLEAVEPFVSR